MTIEQPKGYNSIDANRPLCVGTARLRSKDPKKERTRSCRHEMPDQKRAVLIVHNDTGFLDELSGFFHADGRVEMLTSDNGYDAGRIAREQLPQLIVLNQRVRDLDIVDAVRVLRSDAALSTVRILSMSEEDSGRIRLVQHELDELIPMYSDPRSLFGRVLAHLGLDEPA